jgi:quercetin dioxygenase-like cupin family protein
VILRKTGHGWEGATATEYKDAAGGWKATTKTVLFASEASAFEARSFEILPGGQTDFEAHAHEHFVLVLAGEGEVRLGDEAHGLRPGDVVHVRPHMPHRFSNPGPSPFSILCVVDAERDRPQLLDPDAPAGRLKS